MEKEKFEVIGTVPGVTSGNEDEDDGPVTIRPNRFRPQAGIREQLRTILQEELERESSTERENNSFADADDDFTLRRPNIRTQTRYLRYLKARVA